MEQWVLACSMLLAAALPSPAIAVCAGDCEDDGEVTVDELIKGVNIALGSSALSDCGAFDSSGDGSVTVDEIIGAVNNALSGCLAPQASPTPSATPTATIGVNVSPDLLGIFSGTGINAFGGGTLSVRLEVKVVGGAVVVVDLNGNVFDNGSSITVMVLSPTTLAFVANSGGRAETLQIGLNPAQISILNGTYANVTTTVPPTGKSIALVLNKQL